MLCIELYEAKWCAVHDELPRSMNATLQSVARRFWEKCLVYAEDGAVWRPRPAAERPFSFFSFVRRILAETGLYNPTRPIPMLYEQVGQCTLADLKGKLSAALWGVWDTYYIGEQELEINALNDRLAQIDRAESFQEVARITRAFLSSLYGLTPLLVRWKF
jgi:hypothetical protein